MKCDTCIFHNYESGSSNPEYAQPYPEIYCGKGHWEGGPELKEEDIDPWENCKDYKKVIQNDEVCEEIGIGV